MATLWMWVADGAFTVAALILGLPALALAVSFGSEARYLSEVNGMLRAETEKGA